MKHASLFTGIGGFDLAAEWMGWQNIFQCEIDEWCRKVLQKHFKDTIKYADIKETDFTIHRGKIDILTGGFPCQPFSHAGKRKGAQDDRFLWHEMLRAVREIQPPYIVAENVYGITNQAKGMVFEQVCSEMENEGYEVQPYIIPACAINAPHRRDRVWFIAYSDRYGCNQRNSEHEINAGEGRKYAFNDTKQILSDADLNSTSTKNKIQTRRQKPGSILNANIIGNGLQRNTSESQTQRHIDGCCEIAGWENNTSESPICRVVDGIPDRIHRIKGLGNAIVPQVAYEIFKSINQLK